MGKRINLKFTGNVDQGFQVFWDIRCISNHLMADGDGALPEASHIRTLFMAWRETYGDILRNTRAITATSVVYDGTFKSRRKCCEKRLNALVWELNQWLASSEFGPIKDGLLSHVRKDEDVEILMRTDESLLHYLPWHRWTVLEQYPQSEVGMAPKGFTITPENNRLDWERRYVRSTTKPTSLIQSVEKSIKILAIFGDDTDLDLSQEEETLKKLPNVDDIKILRKCSKAELIDALKEKKRTILFFAGHGKRTELDADIPSLNQFVEKGWLQLNENEYISLDELKYSLRDAIGQGLQVAIFNSCEGMGLAYALAPLNIPSMVVMREQIPDNVAQLFLSRFLTAFSQEAPLFLALRRAREQVEELQDSVLPGVSSLPVLWQNPAQEPMQWP